MILPKLLQHSSKICLKKKNKDVTGLHEKLSKAIQDYERSKKCLEEQKEEIKELEELIVDFREQNTQVSYF